MAGHENLNSKGGVNLDLKGGWDEHGGIQLGED